MQKVKLSPKSKRYGYENAQGELIRAECLKCKKMKPLKKFDRGLSARCMDCADNPKRTLTKKVPRTDKFEQDMFALWMEKHPDGTKACTKCKKKQPQEEYYPAYSKIDGRREKCRTCDSAEVFDELRGPWLLENLEDYVEVYWPENHLVLYVSPTEVVARRCHRCRKIVRIERFPGDRESECDICLRSRMYEIGKIGRA